VADYSLLTDDELLRLTSDDREAFGEFYGRHVRAVLGELRRRGLATDEALDLTAEVFAALVASRRYRPGEAPARSWLLGIARNKLAHRRRRAAGETAARRKLGMARLTYSDEALERVEELLEADAGVYTNGTAALPPAEREAVVARVIDERDYDEIAAASGATAAAIHQRVSRGLAKLAGWEGTSDELSARGPRCARRPAGRARGGRRARHRTTEALAPRRHHTRSRSGAAGAGGRRRRGREPQHRSVGDRQVARSRAWLRRTRRPPGRPRDRAGRRPDRRRRL
jgi:RNA polymerase sigma factor (sigma-70 family)